MDNLNYDLEIEKMRGSIINAINNSGLPISVCYYSIRPIWEELAAAYNQLSQQVVTEYKQQCDEPAPEVVDAEDSNPDAIG